MFIYANLYLLMCVRACACVIILNILRNVIRCSTCLPILILVELLNNYKLLALQIR